MERAIRPHLPDFRGIWVSESNTNSEDYALFSIWKKYSENGVCWEHYRGKLVSSLITKLNIRPEGITFIKTYNPPRGNLLRAPINYLAEKTDSGLLEGKWVGKDSEGKTLEGNCYLASRVSGSSLEFEFTLAELTISKFERDLAKEVKGLLSLFPYSPPSSILI